MTAIAVTGAALHAKLAAAADDDLFLPAEAGELLRVNRKTVQRWVTAGWIRAVRTPCGHRRIPAAVIRGILKGGES